MLLPALSKAREKARAISCTNNMKQNVLSMTLYSEDFDGWFYLSNQIKSSGSWVVWSMPLTTGLTAYPEGNGYLSADKGGARLAKSCYCPSRVDPGNDVRYASYATPRQFETWAYYEGGRDWVYDSNWFQDGCGLVRNTHPAASNFALLFEGIEGQWVAEGDYGTIGVCPGGEVWGRITAHHGGRSNTSFLDGHVESLDKGGMKNLGVTGWYVGGVWTGI